jgi:DNA-directed RNA polymerase subunit RPC12/RpoP
LEKETGLFMGKGLMRISGYYCLTCKKTFQDTQQIYCPECGRLLARQASFVKKKKLLAEVQNKNRFHGRQKGRAYKSFT